MPIHVISFDIRGTREITTWPRWLGSLEKLVRLDFSKNCLEPMATWIGELPQLKELDVYSDGMDVSTSHGLI